MADQGQARELLWTSEATLDLLGPVRLGNTAGDDLTPKARKTRALLALLAVAKAPIPRERLTDLLWGDRGEDQAKASLRQALYELRGLSGSGYLSADRHVIGIGPKRPLTDLGRIQRLIDDEDGAALAAALEAVDYPILGALDGITPELDEWLRDERIRIASAIASGALDVAEKSDPATARRLADQLERLDPLDERAAAVGIRADLAAGDRSAAARRHARLEGRLKDQLGIAPSAETKALLEGTTAVAPERSTPSSARPAAAETQEAPRGMRRLIPFLAAITLIVAVAVAWMFFRAAPVEATPTVAVLPFDEAGQKQSYFAAGVSDEILNLLAHQSRIKVIGRISAEQIGERANGLDVARKLGITHLLDGSVRTSGNRVLVIVRLTRVSDGAQLWSEKYQRQVGDIFAVQGDIASAVAARLAQSFSRAPQQATSPEVYDLYLSARQLIRERREVTLAEGDRLLREAIRLDPQYAPAYAELAQVIMLRADNPTSYGTIPFAQAQAEASVFAHKAVALDPNLGDAYAALGFLSLNLDPSSEPYFRKAVELSPQRPEFHRWHAQSLFAQERYDEAIAEFKQAVEIDPLWGLNYDHLIGALYEVGRQDEARQAIARFLALSTDERAKLLIQRSIAQLDFQPAQTLRVSEVLQRAYPNERQMRFNLASSLAMLGERNRARALLDYDPIATAVLANDWPTVAKRAEAMGQQYWDQWGFWNLASLLIQTGHSDTIVRLYDRSRPVVASGQLDLDKVATPETIIALRLAGRNADANKLLAHFRKLKQGLPHRGLLGEERDASASVLAMLAGDREAALRGMDEWSRKRPWYFAHTPAMALRYDPVFGSLSSDPRFAVIEERVRTAVNAERQKAHLPPISREAWISDRETLLTKN